MKMYKQRRQHPAMILLSAINSVKYAFFPLALMFFNSLKEGEIIRAAAISVSSGFGFFVLSMVYHITHWAFYTYRLESGYLYIKSGIIFKKERSIKRERVQTVNINTGILQRLLGLVTLEVETAGEGGESEFTLTAINTAEANRIKKELETNSERSVPGNSIGSQTTGATDERQNNIQKDQIYQLSTFELFLAGATSGNLFIMFPLLLAAFSQFHPIIPDTFWVFMLEHLTSTNMATVVILIVVLLIFSWMISTIGFIIKYANFTLSRQDNRLEVSWGIIKQQQLVLKLHKIQSLVIQQSVLRQPFGRCALTVDVAGGGSKDDNYITTLFPLINTDKLHTFLSRVIPEYNLPKTIEALPNRSKHRYIIRTIIPVLLVVLPLQLFPIPYLWLGLLLIVPSGLWGYLRFRGGGSYILNDQLFIRYRNLNLYRVIINRKNIQSLQVSFNPIQKLHYLRTLQVSVLSSPQAAKYQFTDISSQKAKKIWDWYSRTKKT